MAVGILGDIVSLYSRFALFLQPYYQYYLSLLIWYRKLYIVFTYDYTEKEDHKGKAA